MQSVGKFYEDNAHVAAHRQKHLAKTFGLSNFVGRKAHLRELADSVHKVGNLYAEALDHLELAHAGVF